MSRNFGLRKDDFRSETARELYEDIFNGKVKEETVINVDKLKKEKLEEKIIEEKSKEVISNYEKVKRKSAEEFSKREKSFYRREPKKVSKPKGTIENKFVTPKIVSKPEGTPPTLRDFQSIYFEQLCGLVGDKRVKSRGLLNAISNTSVIYVGPAGGGKSVIQNSIRGLFPDNSVIDITEAKCLDEIIENGEINGKILFSPELQVLFRGSRNQKDAIKLLSNKEAYKGLKIDFFVTSAAYENAYFQNHILPNKELMRRLDILTVESDFNKINLVRSKINQKRMEEVLSDSENGFTKEYFQEWFNYWRNLEVGKIVDPFCNFHDEYFVKSFKSFDPIKRYHKLEDALLKMHLDESTYQINGEAIRILSIKEKYKANCFRQGINKTLREVDNLETIKRHYGWSDKDFEKYQKSIDKSKKDIDWQVCWESGLESLKLANQKGYLPSSLISEYINRHVVNGKVNVIDDYSGEEILLAEYPKPVNREVIVVTPIEYISPKVSIEYENKKSIEYNNMKCLPEPKTLSLPEGDFNE